MTPPSPVFFYGLVIRMMIGGYFWGYPGALLGLASGIAGLYLFNRWLDRLDRIRDNRPAKLGEISIDHPYIVPRSQ